MTILFADLVGFTTLSEHEGHLSILVGDIAVLRRDLAWFENEPFGGAWLDRQQRVLAAGMLALEGGADEALAAYRRSIAELRAAELLLDLALALIERARLLGSADSESAGSRDEAQRLLEGIGAGSWLARLGAGAGPVSPPAPPTLRRSPAPRTEGASATRR